MRIGPALAAVLLWSSAAPAADPRCPAIDRYLRAQILDVYHDLAMVRAWPEHTVESLANMGSIAHELARASQKGTEFGCPQTPTIPSIDVDACALHLLRGGSLHEGPCT
jgi:hypothetical protein